MSNTTSSDIPKKVAAAERRIRKYIRKTPLDFSPFLSKLSDKGPEVYLKLESEQYTGSFKVRGAFNKLCVLLETDPDLKRKGAIAASSGNHALGCTIAMKKLGVPMQVFTPEDVSAAKKKMLEAYDANLVLHGMDVVDTETKARRLSEEKGIPFISPYNDPEVIAGLGTIGMEIHEDLKDVDAVLVSVGGGGLISGIASYLKNVKSDVKVFGCQPERTKVMYESVKAGRIVYEESGDTLSDGTKGGIEENAVTFELCRDYVDDWVLVSEEQISRAVYFMLDKHHKATSLPLFLGWIYVAVASSMDRNDQIFCDMYFTRGVVEGAAGAAVAAYVNNLDKFSKFRKLVIVICGANMSSGHLKKIITTYHTDNSD